MSPGTVSRRRERLVCWLVAAVLHDRWDARWPLIVAGVEAALAEVRDLIEARDLELAGAATTLLLAEGTTRPHPDWDHRGTARAQLRLLLADRFLERAARLDPAPAAADDAAA